MMKRCIIDVFAWALLFLSVAFSVYWFVVCAKPLDERQLLPDYTGEILGCDFYMRYNEIECLLSGVDPFDVWDEKISHPKYVSNRHLDIRTPNHYEPINAYTPWSYTFFMPLNMVSRRVAWGWYYGLMIVSSLVWSVLAYFYGLRFRHRTADGAFSAAVALMVGPALITGLICANYTVVLAGAFALLAFGLRRNCLTGDLLAGVSLALAMTKPQLSLLFVIPMFFRQRWRPLFLAGGICLAATAWASYLCGKSMVTLILEAPKGNVFSFHGCGLMPKALYDVIVGSGIPEGGVLLAVALVGLVLCAAVTWRIRHEEDWMLLFFPATVFSLVWTYVQPPSHLIAWMPLAVVAVDLLRTKSWRRIVLDTALVACLARFYYIPVKLLQKLGASGEAFGFASSALSDASALGSVVLMLFFLRIFPRRG